MISNVLEACHEFRVGTATVFVFRHSQVVEESLLLDADNYLAGLYPTITQHINVWVLVSGT